MKLSPEAGYINVVLNATSALMSTIDLEILEQMHQIQTKIQEQGLLKMPVLLDYHPIMDKILPLEVEFIGKLVECIRLQREMAPLKQELSQHFITFHQNIDLQ